ncbi:MAG: GntR family transcriptional regulator [Alphaproteobacteria bacterium]
MPVSTLSAALLEEARESSTSAPRGSAANRIYAGLRARILSLDLKPNAKVSRNEVAEAYGVSQAPVRDALQKLAHDGLVISYPQSRTVVSRIDLEHARETQFLRRSVEIEVARALARNAAAEALVPAGRILRMQRLAGEDKDIGEFTALDGLFHLSLFEAAGVARLYHIVAARGGHIDRLRRLNLPDPGKLTEVVQQHEQILRAIRNRDEAAAEGAVRAHLSGTLAASEEIRRKFPDYFGGQLP